MFGWVPKETHLRVLLALVIICSISFIFFLENGYSSSIKWNTFLEADAQEFDVLKIIKGPFEFKLDGQKYLLSEKFLGSEITHNVQLSRIIVYLLWFTFCGLLAISTYWKRFWFLVAGGLSIIFINFLDLDSVEVLGTARGSKWSTILLMFVTLLPAYFCHSVRLNWSWVLKLVVISLPSASLLIIFDLRSELFLNHFIANSFYGFALITFLFLLIIAEEVVFLILYVITQSTGGKNNEKHFSIFGLAYLIYIGIHYAKKGGFIDSDMDILSPYYLLFISIAISFWSLRFKQDIYNEMIQRSHDIRLVVLVMALLTFLFFSMGFVRGNDPSYESMHYLIIYAHLGIGFMFFAYILVNFLTPLIKGLKVYRIAYTEQNFPYVTARLGGLVAIAGFFFLSDQQAFKLLTAAKYNYIGDMYGYSGSMDLAAEYYREGSIYGWDNHYSNYQLGTYYANKEDPGEALYFFSRATKRFPSDFAYVNAANSFDLLGQTERIPAMLREGQIEFPKSGPLLNNLALVLNRQGANNQARLIFESSDLVTSGWGDALNVNKWAIYSDSSTLKRDYDAGSPALKANIYFSSTVNSLEIDTTIFSSPADISRTSYMINSLWGSSDSVPSGIVDSYLAQISDPYLKRDLLNAHAVNLYKRGEVDKSFEVFNNLINTVSEYETSRYLNQLGLMSLDQGASNLAAKYFEQAIDRNHQEARLNLVIAYLEASEWSKAASSLDNLVESDSTYSRLREDLSSILQNIDDDSFGFLYYRSMEIDYERLSRSLTGLSSSQITTLWDKIVYDLWNRGVYEMSGYYRLFEPWLSDEQKVEFNRNTEISKLGLDQKIDVRNSFDVIEVLAATQSDLFSLDEKYEIIVKAVDTNPYSSEYQKQYCLTAIENGLFDYADDGLMKLKDIIPSDEFDSFVKVFTEAKELKRNDNTWTLQ